MPNINDPIDVLAHIYKSARDNADSENPVMGEGWQKAHEKFACYTASALTLLGIDTSGPFLPMRPEIHICEYAANDGALYKRLEKLNRPGNYMTESEQALDAMNLAQLTYREMRKNNDCARYNAIDLCRAACLMLTYLTE